MSKWQDIVRRSVSVVFLLILVMYYTNVTLFCHTHIVNGVTLVHSHLHTQHHHDSDDGGHSVNTITLISTLTNQFLTTGDIAMTDWQSFINLLRTIGTEQSARVVSHHCISLSLRAPPAV